MTTVTSGELPGGDAGIATGTLDSSTVFDKAKSSAGVLIGAFGTVLGFVGITSSEITSILRNDEWAALVVFFSLILSVFVAFLSVVVPKDAKWDRYALFGVALFLISAWTWVYVLLCIPRDEGFTNSSARIAWAAVAAASTLAAAGMVIYGMIRWRRAKAHLVELRTAVIAEIANASANRVSASKEAESTKLTLGVPEDAQRHRDQEDQYNRLATEATARAAAHQAEATKIGLYLQPWLIAFSGLLLGLSVFGAIRVETRNQQAVTIQLSASATSPSSAGYSDLTITVSGPKLTESQVVTVRVCGGRSLKAMIGDSDNGATGRGSCCTSPLDRGRPSPKAHSHSIASTSGTSFWPNWKLLARMDQSCFLLEAWNVSPDASGTAKQSISIPIDLEHVHAVIGSANLLQKKGSVQRPSGLGSQIELRLPSITSSTIGAAPSS